MTALPKTDKEFDQIYPKRIRELSYIHWTPIEVALLAVQWLDPDSNTKVLDIGAGVGKFCIIAAMQKKAKYFGLEMREDLVNVFQDTIDMLGLGDVQIIHDNVLNVEFKDFDAFYYYNPFCEQIAINGKIDNTIEFSQDKYREYEDYVIDQLDTTKVGTKIVTYCSETFTLPSSYELKNMYFDGKLALWEKVK